MLLGTKNTLEWFTETGFCHWVIYYKNAEKGGQPVFRFDEDEEQTQGDAIERLRKALSMLDRGSYAIMALPKQKASGRGAQKVNFEISANHDSPIGSMPAPVLQGISPDEVSRQIADALNKYKTEVELEALRKENALLKKEVAENQKSDPVNAIMGYLGPYMPDLLGLTKPGIAGMPVPAPRVQMDMGIESAGGDVMETITGPAISDEEHERLTHVVSVFYAVSPTEWLTILERMAVKLQENPKLLETIKMFI